MSSRRRRAPCRARRCRCAFGRWLLGGQPRGDISRLPLVSHTHHRPGVPGAVSKQPNGPSGTGATGGPFPRTTGGSHWTLSDPSQRDGTGPKGPLRARPPGVCVGGSRLGSRLRCGALPRSRLGVAPPPALSSRQRRPMGGRPPRTGLFRAKLQRAGERRGAAAVGAQRGTGLQHRTAGESPPPAPEPGTR